VSEEEGAPRKLRNRWETLRKDAGKLLHKNNNLAAEGYWHDWNKKTGNKSKGGRTKKDGELYGPF